MRKPSGGATNAARRSAATDKLNDILANAGKPMAAEVVRGQMEAAGYSRRQVDAAALELSITKRQEGRAWRWSLADSTEPFAAYAPKHQGDDAEDWHDPFPKAR